MSTFGPIKFRMPFRYPSGEVEKAVGFGSLELRESSPLKRKKQSRVIKVCKAKTLDEVSCGATAARIDKRASTWLWDCQCLEIEKRRGTSTGYRMSGR